MSVCFKCRDGIGTIASRDGAAKPYCLSCFLRYCTGVVRENALQHCRLPCDTPLAVAVSGGPNSMMLLRELGLMRCKAREQRRRQRQRGGHPHSDAASELILLPFHLCEDDLVLPPTMATTSTHHDAKGRHETIERVRSTMTEQFSALRKCVQQQPQRWVNDDAVCKSAGLTKARADAAAAAAAAATVDADAQTPTSGVTTATTTATGVPLFEESEMRLFCYGDFLPATYLAEVRHALHATRLSLSDREALYAHVRQQTLCRAAQRVCDEYLQRETAAAAPAEVTATACSPVDVVATTTDGCATAAAGAAGAAHDEGSRRHDTASLVHAHLLLGSNAVRCATAAFEALVTGGGGDGVVHCSGFRGVLHTVVCLRPLRTMLPKETVLYTRVTGIACGYTPALCTGTATRSLRRTLEHFVLTTMASYRTMIFNVLNTVQRLQVHPNAMQELLRGDGDTPKQQQQCEKTRARPSAPPGRTAQRNRDDLRAAAALRVHRSPSASMAASHSCGDKEEVEEVEEEMACGTRVEVAMCCVCGCPSSLPASSHDTSGGGAMAQRQLQLFTVAPTTAMADLFACYACQSLAAAWPASVFGRGSITEPAASPSTDGCHSSGDPRAPTHDMSATALRQLCSILH
ncbi:hypothetical protein NESM_000442300 [Novymonas esmeraldas]|uniref:Cytoplasmic tRNA 2-thiolation protein 2 n=1 Tax=Novymonas esmeraldas TaxID=1808958 RepID=A0AAW0EPV6_9TRYP